MMTRKTMFYNNVFLRVNLNTIKNWPAQCCQRQLNAIQKAWEMGPYGVNDCLLLLSIVVVVLLLMSTSLLCLMCHHAGFMNRGPLSYRIVWSGPATMATHHNIVVVLLIICHEHCCIGQWSMMIFIGVDVPVIVNVIILRDFHIVAMISSLLLVVVVVESSSTMVKEVRQHQSCWRRYFPVSTFIFPFVVATNVAAVVIDVVDMLSVICHHFGFV